MTRISLDRFAPPKPSESRIAGYCDGCGGEIYVDDEVYRVQGAILHAEWKCLYKYVDPELTTAKEEMPHCGNSGPRS